MGEFPTNGDVSNAVIQPRTDARTSLLGELDRRPVLDQLRFSFTRTAKQDTDPVTVVSFRARSIVNALQMSPRDRERMGVRIVAVMPAPVAEPAEDRDQITSYNVFAAFPQDNTFHFVSAYSHNLESIGSFQDGELATLVSQQADEIRDETLIERHRRLAHEIKRIDRTIARYHKSKNDDASLRETDPDGYAALNHKKRTSVYSYLLTSIELQEEYPELQGLLFKTEADDPEHIRVAMTPIRERSLRDRLYDASEPVRVGGSVDYSLSTRLDSEVLRSGYKQFIDDLGAAPDHAAVSAGICRIVGILPEVHDDTPAKPIPVLEQSAPSPLPSVGNEPLDSTEGPQGKQRLSKRQQRIAKKKGKPQGSTPLVEAKSATMQFTSFADIAGLLEGTEPILDEDTDTVGDTVVQPAVREKEETRLTAGYVIRTLLETDPAERETLGLDALIIVSGPLNNAGELVLEHHQLSQYTVSVLVGSGPRAKLVQATRSELAPADQRTEQGFSELDQLVSRAAEHRSETISDRYNRHIAEIETADASIADLRTREQALYAEGTDGNRSELDSIKGNLKVVTTARKSILLSYLVAADELKQTYPYLPLLWMPQDDHSTSFAHLTLFRVREKGKEMSLQDPESMIAPDGVLQPPVEIKINLKTPQQRKRLGHDDIDVRIANLIQQEQLSMHTAQLESLPPEVRDFMSLPLPDKFRRAYEALQRSKGGDMDRSVANTMKRIAMRSALLAQPYERNGIDIFVIGRKDGGGKLLVEDTEFTQYPVYITFHWIDGKKFFDEERVYLAQDPWETGVPSLNQLQQLDKLVKKEASVLNERPEDSYNRLVYQIRFIESQIKVLADQKTPDGPTNDHVESVIDQLQKRKIPMIAAYFEQSDALLAEHPAVGKLYTLQQRDADKDVLAMCSVFDRNIRKRLLNGEETSQVQTSPLPFETIINYHKLQQYARDFDEGDTSDLNRSAVAILDRLGIARRDVGSHRGKTAVETLTGAFADRRVARDVPSMSASRTESSARQFELEAFFQLPLDEQMAKASRDMERTFRREFDPRTASLEQRLFMRTTLLTTSDVREALGIYLFAVSPIDEEGNIIIEDPLTSQYSFYASFYAGDRVRHFEAYRTNLAENPFDNKLATPEECSLWDQAVNTESSVWGEGNVHTYNRLIQEMRQAEVLLRNVDRRSQNSEAAYLTERKLTLLDTYIAFMVAVHEEAPQLGPLFEVDGEFIHAYPVVDHNIMKILWQETDKTSLSRKSKPVSLRFPPDVLRSIDLQSSN